MTGPGQPPRMVRVVLGVVTVVVVLVASAWIATRTVAPEPAGDSGTRVRAVSPEPTPPESPTDPATSMPSRTPGPTTPPAPPATPTSPSSPAPSAAPTRAGPATASAPPCWTPAALGGACPPLTGEDALRWVFTGLAAQTAAGQCAVPTAPLAAGKVLERGCRVPVGDRLVTLRYSEFGSVAASLEHYRSKRSDGVASAADGRLTWRYPPRADTGELVVSSAYAACPFSFSVVAPDAATLAAAEALIQPRAAAALGAC